MRKACLAFVFGAALATALPMATPAGAGTTSPAPPYYPAGPQVGVDQSALSGWQECWSGTYADAPALTDVLAACDGDYLLLAAGPVDSTVFDVLAAAPRDDVLWPTTGNETHEANGTAWYRAPGVVWGGWGFAPAGDTVDLRPCDVLGSYRESGPHGEQRLCWHVATATDTLEVGFRSGATVDLNYSTEYRRAVYEPSPDSIPPTVTCAATPGTLWPPNHELRDVHVTVTVTDEESGPAGFRLVSVTSSEADVGLGAADVPGDVHEWIVGTDDTDGRLRAERSDTARGRAYSLVYEGFDVAGNTARCGATVVVPHDQGGGSLTASASPGPRGPRRP